MIEILALLIAGHFVADYPLQGDFLATAKAAAPLRAWHLFGHSAIHGGVVLLVTGALFLAVVGTVAHMVIDEAKVRKITSFAVDQALHMLCKLALVALLYWGWA